MWRRNGHLKQGLSPVAHVGQLRGIVRAAHPSEGDGDWPRTATKPSLPTTFPVPGGSFLPLYINIPTKCITKGLLQK